MARTKADDNRVEVGYLTDVSGEVHIAGHDMIKNINMIHQCVWTAAGKFSYARKLPTWRGSVPAQSLADQVSDSRYRGLLSYLLNDAGIFHARNELKRGSFE